MMEMKRFTFQQSEKKQVSGNFGTEYAPDRKKAEEVPLRDNCFCSISDAQNVENLVFLRFSKSSFSTLIILRFGQIPTETRSGGSF